MDIENIACFVSVAKHLNFTRAAEESHISQTAMSRKINVLEEELGVTLFFRSKRQVELTPAGREFLAHADKLLSTYENALISTQNCAIGFKQELKIGIGIYEHRLAANAIRDFSDLHPDVNVSCYQFHYAPLAEQLEYGMVDLIISSDQYFNTLHDIDFITVHKEPWHLMVNQDNPISQHSCLTRNQLNGQTMITLNEGNKRHLADRYRNLAHFKQFIQVNTFDTKLLMVGVNKGVAVVPRFINSSTYTKIRFIDLDPPYLPRTFFAACKKQHNSLPVQQFMDLLRQEFCEEKTP